MATAAGPILQQITFLDTRDLTRTADFYERVLGFRLARDQGTCRIYHVGGDAYVGFCQRDDTPVAPYRIYDAFVRDPNGYLIEIQRFWEPLV
jgi:catechol 2,3-dioxygenase-like lactoylglutathione lyase family enzyme